MGKIVILIYLSCIISCVTAELYTFDDFELFSEIEYQVDLSSYVDEEKDEEALDVFMNLFEVNDFMLEDDGFFGDLWNGAKKMAGDAVNAIKETATKVIEKGTKFMAENGEKISKVLDKVGDVAGFVGNKIVGPLSNVAATVGPVFGPIGVSIAGGLKTATGILKGVEVGARAAAGATRTVTEFSKNYQSGGGTPEERMKRAAGKAWEKLKDEGKKFIANEAGNLAGKVAGKFGGKLMSGAGKLIDKGIGKASKYIGKGASEWLGNKAKNFMQDKIEEGVNKVKDKVTNKLGDAMGVDPSTGVLSIDKIKEKVQKGKDMYKKGKETINKGKKKVLRLDKNKKLKSKKSKSKKSNLQNTKTKKSSTPKRNNKPKKISVSKRSTKLKKISVSKRNNKSKRNTKPRHSPKRRQTNKQSNTQKKKK
ncbi:hypothetical protein ENUP19_0041G0039 [Entamoeba nuttalli]|uniref:Uncharacterized protein n=2 Tax=Entamoeba nuttalli TaxID=412467 RepID=K2HDD8_ENTNP|nr:hypothetical protein ENU1_079200 [Entamoeba nuttalli P19]EKE40789.1 hypothetical protein ENU1_079200 [Entamoeba nuttalli P19]|eukprot:XP_008856877.1 hypothetical protein ENU1_079200 [Entamoeba nuttalli P19]